MHKTIAHITDIHLDEAFPKEQGVNQEANWEAVLSDLKSRDIQEVIFGGDIGEPTSVPYLLESLSDYDLTISLGNHDQYENVGRYVQTDSTMDGLYHYREDDYYRYLVMDSSKEMISDQQMDWLRMAVETDKHILLAIHHPVLPVPCYVDGKYALKGREEVKDILLKAGNSVIIVCGHYHMEDERLEGNIKQLLTPACSYLTEKSMELKIQNDRFGYRVLNISPQTIDSSVIYL